MRLSLMHITCTQSGTCYMYAHWLSLKRCCGCWHAQQPEACPVVVPGGQAKQAFVISLLQSVTEVLGLRNMSEVGVQTAQYDGSPLSLALHKLEETYLKQSQVSLRFHYWCSYCAGTQAYTTGICTISPKTTLYKRVQSRRLPYACACLGVQVHCTPPHMGDLDS